MTIDYIIFAVAIATLGGLLALLVITNRDLERTMFAMQKDFDERSSSQEGYYRQEILSERAKSKSLSGLIDSNSNFGRSGAKPRHYDPGCSPPSTFRPPSENLSAQSTPYPSTHWPNGGLTNGATNPVALAVAATAAAYYMSDTKGEGDPGSTSSSSYDSGSSYSSDPCSTSSSGDY
jgi:hypothetical protein